MLLDTFWQIGRDTGVQNRVILVGHDVNETGLHVVKGNEKIASAFRRAACLTRTHQPPAMTHVRLGEEEERHSFRHCEEEERPSFRHCEEEERRRSNLCYQTRFNKVKGRCDGGCASPSRLLRCARNDGEIASAFRCAACLAMTHQP